jgi:hypothetical protein
MAVLSPLDMLEGEAQILGVEVEAVVVPAEVALDGAGEGLDDLDPAAFLVVVLDLVAHTVDVVADRVAVGKVFVVVLEVLVAADLVALAVEEIGAVLEAVGHIQQQHHMGPGALGGRGQARAKGQKDCHQQQKAWTGPDDLFHLAPPSWGRVAGIGADVPSSGAVVTDPRG